MNRNLQDLGFWLRSAIEDETITAEDVVKEIGNVLADVEAVHRSSAEKASRVADSISFKTEFSDFFVRYPEDELIDSLASYNKPAVIYGGGGTDTISFSNTDKY